MVSIPSEKDFVQIGDVEYMILRVLSMKRPVIEAMPMLKLIQRWGVGFDRVDIAAAGDLGIPVTIALGSNSSPVSELALLYMLDLYRNPATLHGGMRQAQREKEKLIDNSFMIKGKMVGLVGCGAIGQQVDKKVQAFGAEVIYHDAFWLSAEKERKLSLSYLGFHGLLKNADIISLHVPLLDSTKGMISARELALMKPSAILINTARGEVVDIAALVEAFTRKRITGTKFDVFDTEPGAEDSSLRKLDNFVLAPHVGSNTADISIDMVDI